MQYEVKPNDLKNKDVFPFVVVDTWAEYGDSVKALCVTKFTALRVCQTLNESGWVEVI